MNSILSGPCTVVQAAPGTTIIALILQKTHTYSFAFRNLL